LHHGGNTSEKGYNIDENCTIDEKLRMKDKKDEKLR
jgi:hypothetical protein